MRGSCPGTALLDALSDEMKAGRPHNHGPESYALELDLVKKVKKACQENLTNEKRSEVFRNTVRGHPDAGRISFG